MPSGRPRKVSSQSARAQGTLAFGPTSNKITKPTHLSQSHKKHSKPDPEPTEKAVAEISTPSPVPEEVKAKPIAESPRLAIRSQQPAKSEVEAKAAKVSDAQVKDYWQAEEDERTAPRVHQEGLSLHEKILRHFDVSNQFGVSRLSPAHGHISLVPVGSQMLTNVMTHSPVQAYRA